MALDRNKLLLKEPNIQIGVWNNVDLITPAVDPLTFFTPNTLGDFGYVRQGSINIQFNDAFVEYRVGTPNLVIRKDLIQRDFMLAFTANQWGAELTELIQNSLTELGPYNLNHIGNDAPVKPRLGILLDGQLVDGSRIYFAMYAAEVTTEDKSATFPGTDYVDRPVMLQAFQADAYEGNQTFEAQQKNYGLIWQPAA